MNVEQEALDLIHKEESHLVLFENLMFNSTLVKNKDLQKKIAQEFPYYFDVNTLPKESTQKEILKLFKKGGLVIPSE